MLETVMLTSVTRRPTRLSTLLATLRLTASASWGIDLPYSAVSVRSMAASSWPTSTETPWVWLLLPPPVMLPRMPLTAWEPPLPILMPSTSWDAMPAIFDTTLSEMLVAPRSVCSGLELSSLIFLLSSVLRYAARRVIRRYIASRIIAPRVATRMDLRLICVSPEPPKRLWTRKLPTNAPTTPIKMVTIIPPGSGPGMAHLASAPAMSPITINATMPMRFHLPQHTSCSHRTRHPQAQYNRCRASRY